MNKLISLLTIGVIFGGISPTMAQQHKRLSPHATDPQSGQDRKIWGELVPYGEVWRTGADEATLLITQKPIVMSGTTIPAGAYTLRTLPNEDGTAKLIINKQIGQWGIGPGSHKEDQDLRALT